VLQWLRDRGEDSERLANYGNIVCSHQRCKNHLGKRGDDGGVENNQSAIGRWSVLQANDCKVIRRGSLLLSARSSNDVSTIPNYFIRHSEGDIPLNA